MRLFYIPSRQGASIDARRGARFGVGWSEIDSVKNFTLVVIRSGFAELHDGGRWVHLGVNPGIAHVELLYLSCELVPIRGLLRQQERVERSSHDVAAGQNTEEGASLVHNRKPRQILIEHQLRRFDERRIRCARRRRLVHGRQHLRPACLVHALLQVVKLVPHLLDVAVELITPTDARKHPIVLHASSRFLLPHSGHEIVLAHHS